MQSGSDIVARVSYLLVGCSSPVDHDNKTRRAFLGSSLTSLAVAAVSVKPDAAAVGPSLSRMGIAATSFGGAIYGPRKAPSASSQAAMVEAKALEIVPVIPGAPTAKHADTLEFLERCHALGAAGIQTHINGDISRLRARAEELGMWMEGFTAARTSTSEQFEKAILDCKAAGCTVARDAMLSGRRYETFHSLDEWNVWLKQTYATIERILPVLEKHKFTMALENHKDWTSEQYVHLFKTYSSEYFGGCYDFGNNISLLDDPVAMAEAAAPFIKATHIKDVAVEPYADGFMMSEVPLGTGTLDVQHIASVLLRANPNIRFALEMITRDPLKVPCLTDNYWVTFPDRCGVYLARTLRYVHGHGSTKPLPTFEDMSASERSHIEEQNIRACFAYARKTG